MLVASIKLSPEGIKALAAQPQANYDGIHRRKHDEEARERARQGHVRIFGRDFELSLPIDWTADPHHSRSWRYRLHTLEFLDVLCQVHEDDDDDAALRMACDVVLDWVRHNPLGGDGVSDFAWYDMAAALRGPLLAYLAREGARTEVLDEEEAEELFTSVLQHGHYLADDLHYTGGHNHGLFQDEGLLLLSSYLDPLPEAQGWSAKARRRVVDTIQSTVSERDAVHLEHSPAYHCTIVNLMRRLRGRDAPLEEQLAELAERMDASAGWLVTPAGKLPPVGDTDPEEGPKWLLRAGAKKRGIRGFFGAGYGIVKTDDAYLMLAAAFHNSSHKHADELSFVLEEGGTFLVGEAGRFAYEETDPRRQFARSPRAHNGLIADGDAAPLLGADPYGSGVEAVGAGDGWYAIEARNPLLARRGIELTRLLLYKPNLALVVLDDLAADEGHAYTRLLHFGHEVGCADTEEGISFEAPHARGTVTWWGPVSRTELVRAQRQPEIQGWFYPHEREELETFALLLESEAASELLGLVLSTGEALRLRDAAIEGDLRRLSLAAAGGGFELVVSRAARRKLAIEQSDLDPE